MFTLAPFISLNYDYGAQMSLEMERWDGQIKQYTATSNGSAHYNLFGANADDHRTVERTGHGSLPDRPCSIKLIQDINLLSGKQRAIPGPPDSHRLSRP